MTLLQSDDYRADWYGYATNQAGHAALVGMPLALLVMPFLGPIWTPIAVALAYGIVWEWLIQRGGMWADSVEDTAHVMAGASVICGAMVNHLTASTCVAAWLCLIGLGVARRLWRQVWRGWTL